MKNDILRGSTRDFGTLKIMTSGVEPCFAFTLLSLLCFALLCFFTGNRHNFALPCFALLSDLGTFTLLCFALLSDFGNPTLLCFALLCLTSSGYFNHHYHI